jgi:hypothetical protein
MSMVRLIYVSHFNGSANPNDIQDILAISRKNNEKRGLTGALCYDPDYFLQCLEGPRDHVNALYKQILCDERHQEVTLLEYCDIHERRFEKWSMAYARIDELTESIILKYSASKVFAPFSMTAKQALGFIEDMAKERAEHLAHEAARLFKVPNSPAHS